MCLTDFTTDLHFESYVAILEDYNALADFLEDNLSNVDADTFWYYAEVCSQMAEDPDKPVLTHFNENIASYGGDKEALLLRAKTAYEESFIPAVLRIKAMLEEARPADNNENDNTTVTYSVDPDKYRETIQSFLNTDTSIDEIYDYLVSEIHELRGYLWEFQSDPETVELLNSTQISKYTPEEYMQKIREMYDHELPYQNSPEPVFKILPQYLMVSGADGVCYGPKLDNPESIIFITHDGIVENLIAYYNLIAHEGYPGHYYNYYTFSEMFDNSYLWDITAEIAVIEAWAEYISIATLDAAADIKKAGDYLSADMMLDRLITAAIEIGVKYYDWNNDEFNDFYTDVLGYETINPEVFDKRRTEAHSHIFTRMSYAYYPAKLFEMRHTLETEGVFDAPDFHKFILDNFYISFDEIEEMFYAEYLPAARGVPAAESELSHTDIPNTGNNDAVIVIAVLLSGAGVILSKKRYKRTSDNKPY
jgi:LPXTG-motif cell wall-anchored protein